MVLRVDLTKNQDLAQLSKLALQSDRQAREALAVALIESCSQFDSVDSGMFRRLLSLVSVAKDSIAETLTVYRREALSADWSSLRVQDFEHEKYSPAFSLPGVFAEEDPEKRSITLALGLGSKYFQKLSEMGKVLCPNHPLPALLCYQLLQLDKNPPFFGGKIFSSPVLLQEQKRAVTELSWAIGRVPSSGDIRRMGVAFDSTFRALAPPEEVNAAQDQTKNPGWESFRWPRSYPSYRRRLS